MSSTTFKMIADYYKELYRNFESKTIPEISSDLDISENTLRAFFYIACDECGEVNELSQMNIIVLLCTKFGSSSRYLKTQKLFLDQIKHRELVKNVKAGAARLNNKRNK